MNSLFSLANYIQTIVGRRDGCLRNRLETWKMLQIVRFFTVWTTLSHLLNRTQASPSINHLNNQLTKWNLQQNLNNNYAHIWIGIICEQIQGNLMNKHTQLRLAVLVNRKVQQSHECKCVTLQQKRITWISKFWSRRCVSSLNSMVTTVLSPCVRQTRVDNN